MDGINKKNKTYLIIGGTSKGGTSSLFDYLAKHPAICPAFIKQTNYFLDEDYEFVRSKSLYKYQEEAYDSFFRDCQQSADFYLESSPDYLYSGETAGKIKDYFKGNNYYLIFILREPVSRFISWYNFGKQIRAFEESLSLREYFDIQKNKASDLNFYNALETGNYSSYLASFFDLLPKEKIKIFFFEDLKKDPSQFMKTFCQNIEIDEGFFENFNFSIVNKTVKVGNLKVDDFYRKIRKFLLDIILKNKLLFKVTAFPRKFGSRIYRKINTSSVSQTKPTDDIIKELKIYYQEEKECLAKLLQRDLPW